MSHRSLVVGGLRATALVAILGPMGVLLTGCHADRARHTQARAANPGSPIPASAIGQSPEQGAAPSADDAVRTDVFAISSQDRWTAIRNANGARLAVVRLSAAGDAALVTWEEFGQFWCGTAIPESDCKGGRWFVIVGRPGVLPERFVGREPIDSDIPLSISTDRRRPIGERGRDMTLGVYIRGGADLPVGKHVHAFEFSVDYERVRGFEQDIRRCRTITVQVPGRRFAFACGGLGPSEDRN